MSPFRRLARSRMNRYELQTLLDREGISRAAYSLDGGPSQAPYAIDLTGLGWKVCHFECGTRVEEKAFGSEDRACNYLLNLLLRDTSTRGSIPSQQNRRSHSV